MLLIMRKKAIVWMLLLTFGTILAQSCNTAKKGCGCGSDINASYKRPKRVY